MTEEVVESNQDGSKKWEPKIIAFLCNWCSYAGADLAGVSRIQYPPNIRIVDVIPAIATILAEIWLPEGDLRY